jgi:phosphatidate cytidylyltransferase
MQINKISPERKLETKKRLNGAIYLVLLALAYVLCALLADPRHKTDPNSFDGFSFYLPLHWGNSIFAILMLGFKIALTFFISIELDNCFIKSNHNKKVIASLFLCLFIPMFCADLLILYFVYFGENQDRLRITPIIYFALFFLTLIILIPTYFLSKLSKNSNKFNNISLPLISFAIIIALNGIIYLCIIRGILTFLILVLIPVCCDVGGYIFGVLFGKHKLAPKISPKKTWEGLFGSFLFTILIIIPIIFLFGVGNGSHYQLQGNFLGNQ